mmetsp:Transcript_44213/g.99749  ORF Transcript_44213/g.99749 Transcript_44213/m.99749 type:complete len:493 (-) Transcript_44213:1044-2522(-)
MSGDVLPRLPALQVQQALGVTHHSVELLQEELRLAHAAHPGLQLLLDPGLVVLPQGERLCGDFIVQAVQEFLRIVPVPVHRPKRLLGHLVRHCGLLQVGLKHDHGERQHVHRVGVGEALGALGVVPAGEGFHHPVNLLRLAWKAEITQESRHCAVQIHPHELVAVRQFLQNSPVLIRVVPEVVPELGLAEPLHVRISQQGGDLPRLVLHEAVVNEHLHAFFGLQVELRHAGRQVHFPLPGRLDGVDVHRVQGAESAHGGHGHHAHIHVDLGLLRRILPLDLPVAHAPGPVHNRPHESDDGRQRQHPQLVLLLGLKAAMLRGGVLPLRDLGQAVYSALENILLIDVAVEIEKKVQGSLGVGAEFVENLKDTELVLERGIPRLQDPQKDLLDKHPDLRLQMVLKIGHQRQENRQRQLGNPWHRAHGIFYKRNAQHRLHGRQEFLRGPENGAAILQHALDELQGELLAPDVLRIRSGAARRRRQHAVLTQGAESH